MNSESWTVYVSGRRGGSVKLVQVDRREKKKKAVMCDGFAVRVQVVEYYTANPTQA